MRRRTLRSKRKAQQILNQVALFRGGQAERHARVVVIDDVVQRGEAAVVIKAAFEMCEEIPNRRSAVASVGCAVGLEVVNANFRGGMQIPAGIGPERLDVAVVALGLATEQSVAAGGRRGIEAAGRRLRRWNCQLVEL